MTVRIEVGDCLEVLRGLPDCFRVNCCVTSPPYFGLRDYGHDGQIGLEPTPDAYVAKMVEVFREVRRVLRDDGTLWLNLGDSYAGGGGHSPNAPISGGIKPQGAIKPKDLIGIPWRVAFALQADGWYLRQDIIWHKPNPMPESVTDRCTKAHEYIFLLSKSARYYCDMAAIREDSIWVDPVTKEPLDSWGRPIKHKTYGNNLEDARDATGKVPRTFGANVTDGKRNRRSVWTVATRPFRGAHFATFPPDLIEPCILAGTSARGCCPKCRSPWARQLETTSHAKREGKGGNPSSMRDGKNADASLRLSGRGGVSCETRTVGWEPGCKCNAGEPVPCVVLDPFGGAGTTGLVADRHHRNALLIELNPEYADMARRRIDGEAPLFAGMP